MGIFLSQWFPSGVSDTTCYYYLLTMNIHLLTNLLVFMKSNQEFSLLLALL